VLIPQISRETWEGFRSAKRPFQMETFLLCRPHIVAGAACLGMVAPFVSILLLPTQSLALNSFTLWTAFTIFAALLLWLLEKVGVGDFEFCRYIAIRRLRWSA